jgi:hypothetical protein
MAFNGAGVFSRIYSWITDRNSGIKILASRMDQEMDGFATGLSNTICRDGQSTITQDIPFNNRKITDLGNATADADALNRITADGRYLQLAASRDFKDVATLLADTSLAYGSGVSEVASGDIVRTREEGFSYEVAASGVSDQHITTAGGVKLYVLANARDEIALEAFGVSIGPTGSDNTALLAHISTVLADFTGVITAGPGLLRTNGTFTVPRHASLVCADTTFTAEDSTGTFDRAVILKRGATPVRIADLSVSTVGVGDGGVTGTLTFAAAHGLSAGDTILIYNPNDGSYTGWRTTYREGEFAKVRRVTSTTEVELDGPLYGSHDHTLSQVYHAADMASGRLEGFTAIAPGSGSGNGIIRAWEVKYGEGVKFLRTASRNSDNASASLWLCYRCEGDQMDEQQWSNDPGFSTQYGFSIANSQDCRFQGRFVGWRHGIATGGFDELSIPNRGIRVHNFEARNHPTQSLIASADWHGNTEFSYYTDGTCYNGGLNIAGDHNTISNICVLGGDGCIGLLGRELAGLSHTIENVRIFTNRLDAERGVALDIGGNSTAFDTNTKRGGLFVVSNFNVHADKQARSVIRIRNRGYLSSSGGAWRVQIRGINVIQPDRVESFGGVVLVGAVSGSGAQKIELTGFTHDKATVQPLSLTGDELTNAKIRMDSLSGVFTLSLLDTGFSTTGAVTMPVIWPKVPYAMASLSGAATTDGSDRIAGFIGTITATVVSPRIQRMDDAAANFAASVSRDVSYVVSLNEF